MEHELKPENQRLLELDRIGRAAHRCAELAALDAWTLDEREEAERLTAMLDAHGIQWRLSTWG